MKIKNRSDLIELYIKFFKSKSHKEIPSASLIPENDPTVLFTTAGMHPLVPYLMGQKHPLGKRLVNVQKCIRTGDIDEVGDEVHHTFFEMLGNWSLGDYFKKETIEFSFEFLTSKNWLGLDVKRLAVSCFGGDKRVKELSKKDEEGAEIWRGLGISKERIAFIEGGVFESENNWWGPAGETGPCGPDTEMFYFTGEKVPAKFEPSDKRWVEIWNDVFMQYEKKKRVILVDGMSCLYDKEFKINEKLFNILESANTKKILVVNGFRKEAEQLLKNKGYNVFSFDGKIKKNNENFFKKLLEEYSLNANEVIYFDHDKLNVESANRAGINSIIYEDNISKIEKFILENIGCYVSLKQKNVDTGMGVERTLAVLQDLSDNYLAGGLKEIIEKIEEISGSDYLGREKEMRIIADHVRAAVFILGDFRGIKPSNIGQGYVLRRLIRRAVRYGRMIGIKDEFLCELAKVVINIYGKNYEELVANRNFILIELRNEEGKFGITLEKGLKLAGEILSRKKKLSKEKFDKLMRLPNRDDVLRETYRKKRKGEDYSIKKVGLTKEDIDRATLTGKEAFLLFQSYGFPLEMTIELLWEVNLLVDIEDFREEFEKHQKLSRTASSGQFKSGLADDSAITTRLHTATHLLNAALRVVLKNKNIAQKGSNINPERLRFDFNFDRKLTAEEISEVENLVNKWIDKGIDVGREEMSVKKAFDSGAGGEFGAKYPSIVSVYTIGKVSKEICTGPHVSNTSEIGKFKILKEESSSAGVRRIKAKVK